MQAMQRAGDQGVAFLAEQLRPASPLAAESVARWLDDLDSARFTTLSVAEAALEKLGPAVRPALRDRLEHKPSLEMQRRIESLLQRLDVREPTGEELRQLRSVQILAAMDLAESKQLLHTLAAGAPEAQLTEAAQQALCELTNAQ
jgi:hypothetical protein